MRFRILSYNIHKGFSPTNTDFVLAEIRNSIREVKPELVFLQEVVGLNKKHESQLENWPQQAQFEYLADQMWTHYAYGRNAVYDHGHHGNAILSLFPIIEWSNTDISTNRFEQRGFLYCRIKIPEIDQHINVFCLHLNLLERGRMKQIQKLRQFINEKVNPHEPLIVAGDFNDWTGKISQTLEFDVGLVEAFFEAQGDYAKTFPAFFPFLKLDRVFCRNVKIAHAQCVSGGHWSRLSDHAALIVDFELARN